MAVPAPRSNGLPSTTRRRAGSRRGHALSRGEGKKAGTHPSPLHRIRVPLCGRLVTQPKTTDEIPSGYEAPHKLKPLGAVIRLDDKPCLLVTTPRKRHLFDYRAQACSPLTRVLGRSRHSCRRKVPAIVARAVESSLRSVAPDDTIDGWVPSHSLAVRWQAALRIWLRKQTQSVSKAL